MAVATRNPATDRYMELIAEFPLRRINTSGEHAKAMRIVLSLSLEQGDRGAMEYLDVLVSLIADFERRSADSIDASRVSAAALIRHRLAERGMSVSSLGRLIGVPQSNLSEMLSGKRGWSKAAIRGLVAHLNIRAERFLV